MICCTAVAGFTRALKSHRTIDGATTSSWTRHVATSPQPESAGTVDDLLLRVTPPRVPRDLFARPRLLANAELLRDRPALVVQAPAGFGKTSLLAQWRREHLAQGTVVAWVSAQRRDEPHRLVLALVLAMRTAAGRPSFGHTLTADARGDGLEAVTEWLTEVAQSALSTVLMVDEAERLPPESIDLLGYVMRNAPPNLRVVVAARADCNLGVDDLTDYGQCFIVGTSLLRFQLDETIHLARGRIGQAMDADAIAHLHDVTEGWPLGVQLALSIMASGKEGLTAISAAGVQHGGLSDRFMALMLANLAPGDLEFLTRIAILEHVHPELCAALVPDGDVVERLERLGRDTPVFVAADQGEWMRMHTLARDALRRRFSDLPPAEQASVHVRATGWLEKHGLVEAAARHALAAGRRDEAFDLAERGLYESLSIRGRQGAVLELLARLPDEELDRRPRLLLAAAWSLALSERHEQAAGLVARLLARPEADDALRCECALISSGAAVYADDPDRFAELHDPWSTNPPLRDPLLLQVHANRSALRALVEGDPALARLRIQQAPPDEVGPTLSYVRRWADFFVAMTYVWEGQVLLAENLLRPTLAAAEVELGRRSPLTCMLASLLAAAAWERDAADDAAALLAGRIDVLEHAGLPETLLLAYRTSGRIAVAQGAEARAIEILDEMHAVGRSRNLPRLSIASLTEQARMHARSFHAQTCRELCERIDALLASEAPARGPLWTRSVEVWRDLAHGFAAIAAREWRAAIGPLERAEAAARRTRLTRLRVEIMGLRAWALDRCGEMSAPLLHEATDLARAYGLLRVFADAHPSLGEWVLDVARASRDTSAAGIPGAASGSPPAAEAPRDPAVARTMPSMALTSKEREVLELLARNLTNKEIALALQVSDQTIKWHLKNLFSKLDAGTRKQAVLRARILGLLEYSA
jgi:LuxR family maltose regulon positive regulatory protein